MQCKKVLPTTSREKGSVLKKNYLPKPNPFKPLKNKRDAGLREVKRNQRHAQLLCLVSVLIFIITSVEIALDTKTGLSVSLANIAMIIFSPYIFMLSSIRDSLRMTSLNHVPNRWIEINEMPDGQWVQKAEVKIKEAIKHPSKGKLERALSSYPHRNRGVFVDKEGSLQLIKKSDKVGMSWLSYAVLENLKDLTNHLLRIGLSPYTQWVYENGEERSLYEVWVGKTFWEEAINKTQVEKFMEQLAIFEGYGYSPFWDKRILSTFMDSIEMREGIKQFITTNTDNASIGLGAIYAEEIAFWVSQVIIFSKIGSLATNILKRRSEESNEKRIKELAELQATCDTRFEGALLKEVVTQKKEEIVKVRNNLLEEIKRGVIYDYFRGKWYKSGEIEKEVNRKAEERLAKIDKEIIGILRKDRLFDKSKLKTEEKKALGEQLEEALKRQDGKASCKLISEMMVEEAEGHIVPLLEKYSVFKSIKNAEVMWLFSNGFMFDESSAAIATINGGMTGSNICSEILRQVKIAYKREQKLSLCGYNTLKKRGVSEEVQGMLDNLTFEYRCEQQPISLEIREKERSLEQMCKTAYYIHKEYMFAFGVVEDTLRGIRQLGAEHRRASVALQEFKNSPVLMTEGIYRILETIDQERTQVQINTEIYEDIRGTIYESETELEKQVSALDQLLEKSELLKRTLETISECNKKINTRLQELSKNKRLIALLVTVSEENERLESALKFIFENYECVDHEAESKQDSTQRTLLGIASVQARNEEIIESIRQLIEIVRKPRETWDLGERRDMYEVVGFGYAIVDIEAYEQIKAVRVEKSLGVVSRVFMHHAHTETQQFFSKTTRQKIRERIEEGIHKINEHCGQLRLGLQKINLREDQLQRIEDFSFENMKGEKSAGGSHYSISIPYLVPHARQIMSKQEVIECYVRLKVIQNLI